MTTDTAAMTLLAGQLRSTQSSVAASREIRVYRRLIFNNIRSFIRSGFPVLRAVLGDKKIDDLVARFIAEHRSQTPYFMQIGEAFIQFVSATDVHHELPPFALELMQWERAELSLDIAGRALPERRIERSVQPRDVLACSPLVHLQVGWYPVHRISRDHQPTGPSTSPVCLVAWRGRDDQMHFMECQPLLARLIEYFAEAASTPVEVAERLAEESQQAQDAFKKQVLESSQQLYDRDILIDA